MSATPICTLDCTGSGYGDPASGICTNDPCLNNYYKKLSATIGLTTPITVPLCLQYCTPYYADNNVQTGFCVQDCPTIYYGNSQHVCVLATNCDTNPSITYGYANPLSTVRICQTTCPYDSTNNFFFAGPTTRKCNNDCTS
jgi:hypothetical protein